MVGEQVQKMDVKKSRSSVAGESQKAFTFVGDVKQELKKVEWTSKEEIKSYTKIVLISTLVFATFIYLTDLIIQGFFGLVNLIVKFLV